MQAYITKTRLMGVVAAYIVYEGPLEGSKSSPCYDFFHVEFETFGLDRYEHLVRPSDKALQQLKAEIFGGLGGPLVAASPKQVLQLLVAAYAVDPRAKALGQAWGQSQWLREALASGADIDRLGQAFDAHEFGRLMDLCCEELRSPFEYSHYFLMRYLGHDLIYLRYAPQGYPFLKGRYTLMRNHLQRQDDDSYHFSALVLAEDYALLEGTLSFDEGIVEHFSVDLEKPLSQLEASLLLKKPEYIYLYDVDGPEVETQLATQQKAFAVNLFARGRLYTCYRPHNDHVNAKTFFLNGDVEVYFYFTDSQQLVLVADDLKSLIKWDDYLVTHFGQGVDKYEEWTFDTSVLYDFIDSPYVDFDTYIQSEH